ncbi:hypothetical protein ES708_00337 [subsurface metagenome]
MKSMKIILIIVGVAVFALGILGAGIPGMAIGSVPLWMALVEMVIGAAAILAGAIAKE